MPYVLLARQASPKPRISNSGEATTGISRRPPRCVSTQRTSICDRALRLTTRGRGGLVELRRGWRRAAGGAMGCVTEGGPLGVSLVESGVRPHYRLLAHELPQ